jgi:hypothetical protein
VFDQEMMNHLGEEEEFVIPLCMSTCECLLHGPRPNEDLLGNKP